MTETVKSAATKVVVVIALAVVTAAEGAAAALATVGLTNMDATAVQVAIMAGIGAGISVLVNGVGRLHRYLAAVNNRLAGVDYEALAELEALEASPYTNTSEQ